MTGRQRGRYMVGKKKWKHKKISSVTTAPGTGASKGVE